MTANKTETIADVSEFLLEHTRALVSIKLRNRTEKVPLYSVRIRHPDLQESGTTAEAPDLHDALTQAMDGYDAMYAKEPTT